MRVRQRRNRVFMALLVALLTTAALACGDGDARGGAPGADRTPRGVSTRTTATSPPVSAPTTADVAAPGTSTSGARSLGDSPDAIEATIAAAAPDLAGGDPDAAPRVIGTAPAAFATAIPGAQPARDVPEAAVARDDIALLIDLDAATPQTESSREVSVGETIRIAVVLANAPEPGVAAFNFNVDYDRRRAIAPTIADGKATDRNPDLNAGALGGHAAGWQCLPAPQGDLDDPGGIEGDGLPDTGEAFLSCFTPATGTATGDLVLATLDLGAIAPGTLALRLRRVSISASDFTPVARCPGDPGAGPEVPCEEATLTIR
jgi:hypothetical protein